MELSPQALARPPMFCQIPKNVSFKKKQFYHVLGMKYLIGGSEVTLSGRRLRVEH